MIRVLSVIGTRPEAIKMAPVIMRLRERSEAVQSCLCSTGQHREMLHQALDDFGLVPDVDLGLMQPGQTLSQVASRLLAAIEPVLAQIQPDWILVQGDTTTVMASAIAAHHARVKVGHVEAGLRTGDRANPFPEEMNRVVTDAISDLCFAPTARAREALLAEGIHPKRIVVTGNTVVDALRWMQGRPSRALPDELLALPRDTKLVLVTAHRRESFGAGFEEICQAILALARRFTDVHFVYPVHLNPSVQEPVFRLLSGQPNIHLIQPLPYLPFVALMDRATLILTDSGGIQEEAPSLGVPVLVMRDTTERPEAVEAGSARLVGTDRARIVAEAARLLEDPAAASEMRAARNPYGDGQACARIIEHCTRFLEGAA